MRCFRLCNVGAALLLFLSLAQCMRIATSFKLDGRADEDGPYTNGICVDKPKITRKAFRTSGKRNWVVCCPDHALSAFFFSAGDSRFSGPRCCQDRSNDGNGCDIKLLPNTAVYLDCSKIEIGGKWTKHNIGGNKEYCEKA